MFNEPAIQITVLSMYHVSMFKKTCPCITLLLSLIIKMEQKIDVTSLITKAFDDFKSSADRLSATYRDIFAGESRNTSGIIVIDQDSRIAFFNEAAEKLIGLSSNDVLGKYYLDVFSKVSGGNTKKKREKGGLKTDPAPLLAVMGDIVTDLAHRMRSPLSAIQLLAEILMQDLDIEKQAMVEDILIGVNSLDAVLSNLLLFAQPVKPNFQKINILMALEESLLFAAPAIRQQKILLNKEYVDSALYCSGDLEQLKQVWFNLILNAIQAMPEGGELNIKASYNNTKTKIRVEIKDSGTGITNEDMGKVFIPFFTTKENAAGLGLCIVYKIIQAHSGSIQINSSYGFGTTVSVVLPVNVTGGQTN